MKLEMRRKSWDWKAMKPRVFAPRLGNTSQSHRDNACRDCGYHVCSCGPKAPLLYVPADDLRQMEKDLAELKALAPKPESELPPGWRRFQPSLRHNFTHEATGIGVWLGSAGQWSYGSATSPGSAVGVAPTRDEAMARALGWEKVSWQEWELPGAPNGMCVWMCPGGTWLATASDLAVRDLASLPHAIAWCRGDK